MGAAVSSCFGVRDILAHGDETHQSHGNYQCFVCSVQNLMNQCRAMFHTEPRLAAPTSNEGLVSSNSVVVHNASDANNGPTIRSRPNTANTGYSRVPQEAERRIRDKVSIHSRVGPEPLRNSACEVMPKVLLVDPNSVKKSNEHCPESSLSFLPSKVGHEGGYYALSSSEDEDICPTCLEEYTPENPKIVTKCSHHYHLSCIYEWMERSETCPVCGRSFHHECSHHYYVTTIFDVGQQPSTSYWGGFD